jgi:RNA polymerase sigma-70 factor (ECF subfamily)
VIVIQTNVVANTPFNSTRADFDYMEGIRSSNSEAFASLFRKYYEPLYRFAGRFVKDAQTAESVVQDVFVKLWEKREELHIQSSVKSYLYTAVKNHSLNHLKREKAMVPVDGFNMHEDDRTPSPEQVLIDNEMMVAVHGAIDKLPPQCRRIYRMKKYDGLSYSEIAEVLNISINTVKTQMKRALKSLHKQLAYLVSLFWIFFS